MSKLYKLLLVDDEEPIRTMLLNFLSRAKVKELIDLEIKECANGAEAWDYISSEGANVDIVVSDINMPELDGFELTKRIKTTYPKIKVILMTGLLTDKQFQKIVSAGADGYIAKPFELKKLLEIIKGLLV
ncbi:response regulator [Candidatus Falkowbacteria bacterium CG11_big_fil_rev_8_21_14_0_20_39_10]|uniref:Response regulator n=1 Tax=Candidatus Falkowbacteria bacterium CG11_big_fil_rev_8_21_14_0_20_39_10 TaxID=1974570 RepID=A0A2M6KA87_9BACT|nr:MAG: response regulator [Candidatus Falkowbacteria bacterium CG11_big_fil_rev_8_21_14_0_20_39_10]